MKLKAWDVSSGVLSALPPRPRRGKVHSVFERTVNILCGGDLWVSLHPRGLPRHPYSVTVDVAPGGEDGRFLGAAAGEAADVSAEAIELGAGRVSILLDGARVWDCAAPPLGPAPQPKREPELAAAVSHIRRRAGEHDVESPFLQAVLSRGGGMAGGAAACDAAPSDAGLRGALCRKASQILVHLEDAWESRSEWRLAAALRMSAGLGVGLTPAGDDFILGLAAADHCAGGSTSACHCRGESAPASTSAPGPAPTLLSEIDAIAGSTTLLSGFMLKAASQGRWPEPVRDLIAAIGACDLLELDRAVDRTLALGATSGQDVLAGIIFGLEAASVGSAGIGERCHAANLD
jgi:hypothetical protein